MTDTDNLTRRRFLKATGGAASAAAVAGCTGDNNNNNNNNNQNSGNQLSLINSTMTTLDPIKATDTASGTVIQQIFDPLMNYPNAKTNVKKLIAKSHSLSEDKRTYTLKLKEGVQFHGDYGEVTAEDVVYSWKRLAMSKNSRRAYFVLSSIGVKHETKTVTYTNSDGEEEEMTVAKPGSLAVRKKGKYEVEMELEEPFHSTLEMLAYTSFAVIPKGIVGDIEGADGEMKYSKFATKNPIGAGPFKFGKWQSNQEAKVDKFEDYHGEKAKVDSVHWKIFSDSQTRYTYAFQNQNVDIAYDGDLPTSQYNPKKIKNTSTDDLGRTVGKYGPVEGNTLDYLGVSTIGSYYIGFNTNAVPKPVRKAVAYAVNQETIVKEIFKQRGEPSYHFTPPMIYPGGAKQYEQHAKNNYPYGYNEEQLQKAQKLIEEETEYGKGNPFKFTFTVYQSSSTWPKVGKLIRDKLQSAHIEMNVEKAPFSTLLQRGRKGNLEAYSLGWIMDWPAPDNFLQLLYPPLTDTSKSSPISYTNWSGTEASKQATDAWDKIQNNTAPTDAATKKRNEAYVAMEEANWDDVVFLNMYHDLSERFTYEHVDAPKYGGADYSRQMYNKVQLNNK
ncbi:ABC transporter substrate-binding protein [Halomicrococcus sp. SG-WS-1]|uniref:ABC transporter substrate-binding protein n=1 Tax=Halomicrococcus sp. SG-WS-1 TaxID=3439057 RepID=UPI003F79C190